MKEIMVIVELIRDLQALYALVKESELLEEIKRLIEKYRAELRKRGLSDEDIDRVMGKFSSSGFDPDAGPLQPPPNPGEDDIYLREIPADQFNWDRVKPNDRVYFHMGQETYLVLPHGIGVPIPEGYIQVERP